MKRKDCLCACHTTPFVTHVMPCCEYELEDSFVLKEHDINDFARVPNWDTYFLQMCFTVATRSKDPSTTVGAIIVGPDKEIRSTGYNDFPRGVKNYPSRWERPEKYEWVVHAEHNAILNAARMGASIAGCTLYMPYDCNPCHGCCRAIIQAGIVEVVTGHVPFPGKGTGTHYDIEKRAEAMLEEAGVNVRRVA